MIRGKKKVDFYVEEEEEEEDENDVDNDFWANLFFIEFDYNKIWFLIKFNFEYFWE